MTQPSRPGAAVRAIYARLLICYPPAFRARFGSEARQAFESRLATWRGRGRVTAGLFIVLAFADVAVSGLAERAHARRRSLATAAPQRSRSMTWDMLLGDARLAFRLFRRAPGPTLLSLVTLAIGIGTCTAMFSVTDGVIWRPLPYADPDALVRIRGGQSYPDLQDWASETSHFDGFGGFRAQPFDRQTPDGTERLAGALVTGRLFDVLGTRPRLGRLIADEDDRPGGEHVAVISHAFWRRAFAGREDVVGETLQLIDGAYRVIGVLPQDFELWLTPAEVIAAANAESTEFGFRGVHGLTTVARLGAGTSLETAQAEMDALALRLEQRYPQQNRDRRFLLQPLQASLVARIAPTLFLLSAAAVLVWVVACLNVTNLQLGRALDRRAEMATRRALGASRLQLLRQLLVEQLVLAAVAGAAGLVAARWLLGLLGALSLEDVPRLDAVGLDGRVFIFTALTSVAAALLFGVIPAIVTTGRSVGASAGHGTRVSQSRRRLVAGLLVAEIAASAMLMIGGGLLLNSYTRLMHVNPGFDPGQLLTFNLTLRPLPRTPRPTNREEAARATAALIGARSIYYEQVIDAMSAIPGVTAVAASTDLPIAEGSQSHNLSFERRQVPPGSEPSVYYRGVNPGFFLAFGMPLTRGREFTAADRAGSIPVAVVNETFARTHYPGEDPIGQRIRWTSGGENDWVTIVGVAADVKGLGLDADEVPAVYGPFTQDGAVWRRYMDFAVRTSVDPASLGAAVRRAVAAVDPTVPVMRLQTMDRLIAGSVVERRIVLLLLSVFAIAALTLAAVGLYGAMSYAVRARTPELGVRLALGATPSEAVQLILRQAWWCIAIGLVLGVSATFASVRVLNTFLFQTASTDVSTYGLALAGVTLVALLSAVVPAARAARIDPLIVLKRQ